MKYFSTPPEFIVIDIPKEYLDAINKHFQSKKSPVLDDKKPILEGNRNTVLTSLAGSLRQKGLSKNAILAALHVINHEQLQTPLPDFEIETIATSISRYQPNEARHAADFAVPQKTSLCPLSEADFENIPPRKWVMQNRYIGGFISVVIASGGVGKSLITMLDAISIATEKHLTGFKVKSPGAVWIYNTEDPIDELYRRANAICLHHSIDPKSLKNVYISSGRDEKLTLVRATENGIVVNKEIVDYCVTTIKEKNIKLFLVDPFVRTHECNENDNMQIDKVMSTYQHIANETDCAICLVHHTNKAGARSSDHSTEVDMNISRGATSMVYAARIAHTVSHMTESECRKFGIPGNKRKWFLRLDNAKANLQPPADQADWYEKISVPLSNGDFAGTIELTPMSALAKIRKDEATLKELDDFAFAFSEILEVGQKHAVSDIADLFCQSMRYAHLFNSRPNHRTLCARIVELLENGVCKTETKEFVLVEENKKRKRFFVKCELALGFLT